MLDLLGGCDERRSRFLASLQPHLPPKVHHALVQKVKPVPQLQKRAAAGEPATRAGSPGQRSQLRPMIL